MTNYPGDRADLESILDLDDTSVTYTYAVEKGSSSNTPGGSLYPVRTDWWTVVQYADGVCKGGDHHWVRERFALRAMKLYQLAPKLHGEPSDRLIAEYVHYHLGEKMFDTDEEAADESR